LAERQAELGKAVPEVWAMEGALPVVLAGFGEDARERQARSGLGWALFWLVLALGWVAAMALTPSLQLRETALDAQEKYAAVGKSAANALGQREALLASNSRLKEVDDALANRADPKLAIEVLTKALDDGVFLQRLDVKGRNVSISGQAANATALVQTLSVVPGLEDVKATAAATRQLNGTERFTIDFVLKPPPPPAAPEAAPAQAAEAPSTAASDQAVKP
jgi:general secretion pathway protein L